MMEMSHHMSKSSCFSLLRKQLHAASIIIAAFYHFDENLIYSCAYHMHASQGPTWIEILNAFIFVKYRDTKDIICQFVTKP